MYRVMTTILILLFPFQVYALPPETLRHVVSVLPVWPGMPQGGSGAPPGSAPEGSGVAISTHLIVTAAHVIGRATQIDIRLHDGRIVPVELVASDDATDIALLRSEVALAPIKIAAEPALAEPVCAIGNAFGLGLSVSCGVVSALHVTNAGFNSMEDFVQTDAAVNPGSSGGALVNADGELVGMLSAIFASGADANLGINFAISTELLQDVASALDCQAGYDPARAGWQLRTLSRVQLRRTAGAFVESIVPDGPAADSGVEPGDIVIGIGTRTIRSPSDAEVAVALAASKATSGATILRNGVQIDLPDFPENAVASGPDLRSECYQSAVR